MYGEFSMCFLPLSYFLVAGWKILGQRMMKQLGITTNPLLETQSFLGSKYHVRNFWRWQWHVLKDVICANVVICAGLSSKCGQLTTFWRHFDDSIVNWPHFDNILTTSWRNFDAILTQFWHRHLRQCRHLRKCRHLRRLSSIAVDTNVFS